MIYTITLVYLTDTKAGLDEAQVFVFFRIDDSKRTKDPWNSEKYQHGARTTQASEIVASADYRLCQQQLHQISPYTMYTLRCKICYYISQFYSQYSATHYLQNN